MTVKPTPIVKLAWIVAVSIAVAVWAMAMLALAAGVVMAAGAVLVAVAGWLEPGWSVVFAGVWVVGTLALAAAWQITRIRLAGMTGERDGWRANYNAEVSAAHRRSSIHWNVPDDEEELS